MPEKEVLNNAGRLIEKQDEILDLNRTIKNQKEEFSIKMEIFKTRKDELAQKEIHFKQSVVKFDKFLKENDTKLRRAVKKAQEERDLQTFKQNEIDRLSKEIKMSESLKEKLSKKISKHLKYIKFLENVLEHTHQFQEVQDLIFRFDTLDKNLNELIQLDQDNDEIYKNKLKELSQFKEKKNLEILNMNNTLADLRNKFEKAYNNRIEAENIWTHIKNTATEETLLIGKTRMAIKNLYEIVLNHQGKVVDKDLDITIDEQLKTVLDLINDLTNIKTELDREEQSKLRISDSNVQKSKTNKKRKELRHFRRSKLFIIDKLNPPTELDLNELGEL